MAGNLHTEVSERRHSHVNHPVPVAATTWAEYDRVQDGPEAIYDGFPLESHQRPV